MTIPEAKDPKPEPPDYLLNRDSVLKDTDCDWRYGKPPDYSKTRAYYEQTKSQNHEAGSLPDQVENFVKNWEIEMSWKTNIDECRTVNPKNYMVSVNGGPCLSGAEMIKLGTYNAILSEGNEYYDPKYSDFATSHKTFKRMMPVFAWEVLEVYTPPPFVIFKWRHWGVMKSDYSGHNNKGEKVTAEAHGGTIDVEGFTVAHLDEHLRATKLEISFNAGVMFRQIDPRGLVMKQRADVSSAVVSKTQDDKHGDSQGHSNMADVDTDQKMPKGNDESPAEPKPAIAYVDVLPASSSEVGLKRSKSAVSSDSSETLVTPAESKAPKKASEDMGIFNGGVCPFLNGK